jgi:hypothetical protein
MKPNVKVKAGELSGRNLPFKRDNESN